MKIYRFIALACIFIITVLYINALQPAAVHKVNADQSQSDTDTPTSTNTPVTATNVPHPKNTHIATQTPTDIASPTNTPIDSPSPSIDTTNCTRVTVYLNGVAVVACQEQLQGQNQSINFNPVINNDPTNNNNNNNTNNNNINLANNNGNQVLGAVYSPSRTSQLPGTGTPTVIWELLGGITPLGLILRKISGK